MYYQISEMYGEIILSCRIVRIEHTSVVTEVLQKVKEKSDREQIEQCVHYFISFLNFQEMFSKHTTPRWCWGQIVGFKNDLTFWNHELENMLVKQMDQ